jgi:hypothetical protein
MCDADKDCQTCEDFMECSTEDPKYVRWLEDAGKEFPVDDDSTRWW